MIQGNDMHCVRESEEENGNLTEEVKRLVLSNEIDLVGVAPVERFVNAPEGHRPEDLLPGARSVISLGMKMSLGPQVTQRIALTDRRFRHASFSYRWFAYGLLNQYFMDRGAFLVVKLLEERGYMGLPTVASGVEDLKNIMAAFSQRHAAVAAGLGEFGWNGVALVPGAGPRVRFVSIITTAPLAPDPMYSGPRLCEPNACRKLGGGVQLCVRVCPIQVISPDRAMMAVIGEKPFVYGWKDYMMCGKTVGVGLHPAVLGPEGMVVPDKIDWETSMQLRSKMPARESLETLTYARGHFCGLCVLRCPVGKSAAVERIMKGREVTCR